MVERDAGDLDTLVAAVERRGGGIEPEVEQLRGLLESGLAGPLEFVNLLAFRSAAEYPGGHELAGDGSSGVEAYGRYAAVALEHVARRGGRIVLFNEVDLLLVGSGPGWDQIAIIEYPGVDAFVDMISDPEYVAALVHREAGLERTELLVTRSLLPAEG